MEITQIKTFNNKMDSFMDKLLPELEEIYKDIHRNPELSMQELRTYGRSSQRRYIICR